jgi:hypothetical protein
MRARLEQGFANFVLCQWNIEKVWFLLERDDKYIKIVCRVIITFKGRSVNNFVCQRLVRCNIYILFLITSTKLHPKN